MKTRGLDFIFLILVIVVGAFQLLSPRVPVASPVLNIIALAIMLISGVYFLTRIKLVREDIGPPKIATALPERNLEDTVFNYITQRYGIGYLSIDVECDIGIDGSATVRRQIEFVAKSDISSLDTSLNIPTEKDGTWDLERLAVYSTTRDREVIVDDEKSEFKTQSVWLTFSPTVRRGSEAGYVLVERLPKGFYSFVDSYEDLKKNRVADEIADLYDYFGWHINRPTKYLKLKVTFPESWKPQKTDSKVLLAKASGFPSTIEQREEIHRTEFRVPSAPGMVRYYLELEIKYPMIGLIYLTSWLPVFSNDQTDTSDRIESDRTDTITK